MLFDIHLRHRSGSAYGKCHIRVCRVKSAGPIVFVCSQYRNYNGISVTNAAEEIIDTLFHEIANRNIEQLSFEFKLPLIQRWHEDVNLLDKALARLFPKKYERRFSTERLDLFRMFKHVIWLEHYAAEQYGGNMLQKVELDEHWHPNRVGRPSEDWLIEHTGLSSPELLPSPQELDLAVIEGRPREWYAKSEVLQSKPGFHVIRWGDMLARYLPSFLTETRFFKGDEVNSDLPEGSIHEKISRMFAKEFPSPQLFKSEHYVSERFYSYTGGTPKKIDFAIFKPEGGKIDAFLEVKRTSSSSADLRAGIMQDMARLLLLSRNFRCACYLLVCGDTNTIHSQLGDITDCMSFDDHCSFRDRHFQVPYKYLTDEYKELLLDSAIVDASTRLHGMRSDGSNRVMLWQVAADLSLLVESPIYRCDIKAVERG